MSADIATLSIQVDSRPVKDADSAMDSMAATGEKLEGIVRKVAAAWASWEIVKQIRDVTTLAARYDTLGVVMQTIGNNAGYTGKEMAGFQASLEKTGISMLAARQSLTMMAAAQLDLTKASQLGRVAQDAAVIGNVNSSEAFETLTRSITTGMAIEAHRLGIMVNYRRAEHDYAAAIGKTTEQLSDQEKQAARLSEVLEQGAKRQGAYESAMETAGKQALSMERYVENLKVKLGETFQGAYAVIIQDMTAALQGAAGWVDKNAKKVKELGDAMGTVAKQGVEFTKLLADIGGGASGASNSVGFLTRITQGLSFLLAGTTDILRAFAGQFVGFIGFLVQKLGAVVDTMTRLAGWGGKGGISKAGDSVANWGQSIMAPLQSGNSALTSWYDDVLGDKAASGSSKAAEALEKQRIAAAKAARAMQDAAGAGQSLYEVNHRLYQLETLRALGPGKSVPDDLLAPALPKLAFDFKPIEDSATSMTRKIYEAAAAGNTFAIVSREIMESSGYAADSITRWANNTDGLGRSWTTLGNTVRSVLHDMIVQMEQAIIKQKLLDPLFKAGADWIFNWGNPAPAGGGTTFGSGSGWSTSGGVGAGGFTGKLFAAPGGGSQPTIVNNIAVSVTDGKASVSADAGKGGEDIAKNLKGLMNQWAVEQSRSGGLLART